MTPHFLVPAPRRISAGREYNASSAANIAKRLSCFAAASIFGGVFCIGLNDGQARLGDFLYAQLSNPAENIVYAIPAPKVKAQIDLNAKSVLSVKVDQAENEDFIYKKNIDEQLPIASLTKLMTAVEVVESPEIYDLWRQVVITNYAASQDDVPIFGNLLPGEIYNVRQLLNMMLFYSSNDAASALAEIMGEDYFIEAMNAKAAQMGLDKTVFFNPNGLDRDDGKLNLSSANDLLKLVKYISHNHPEILAYSTQAGPYLTENGIFNLNFWDGQKLVGGKTGYTIRAGGCMAVVYMAGNNRRYVNILLGASTPQSRVVEMQKLINYTNNSGI